MSSAPAGSQGAAAHALCPWKGPPHHLLPRLGTAPSSVLFVTYCPVAPLCSRLQGTGGPRSGAPVQGRAGGLLGSAHTLITTDSEPGWGQVGYQWSGHQRPCHSWHGFPEGDGFMGTWWPGQEGGRVGEAVRLFEPPEEPVWQLGWGGCPRGYRCPKEDFGFYPESSGKP